MGQIGKFFDQVPKYRASNLAPNAACTSRSIAGDRIPSVPKSIANSTGRCETRLVDHRLIPDDLSIYDFAGEPSFGKKAESQAMVTSASQELMGSDSVTYNIIDTPEERHQHSQAMLQSLTTQEIIDNNTEWLGDTFLGELDEWNIGDMDAVAD